LLGSGQGFTVKLGFFFSFGNRAGFGLEPLLGIGFADVLFAGFEEQWFGELECNTIYLVTEVIDAADTADAIEHYRVEGIG
jgi:hypothetical protein